MLPRGPRTLDSVRVDNRRGGFALAPRIDVSFVKIIMDEMKNDEAIDALVRKKLETQKRIVEGSDEWDVLYRKYYEEETARHRKVMP